MLTPTGEREGGAGSKESEISEAAAEGSVQQVPDLQEEDSYNSLHSGSGGLQAPSHAHSLTRARARPLSLSLSRSLSPSSLPLLFSLFLARAHSHSQVQLKLQEASN